MNGIIINPNAIGSVIASSKIALFLSKKFGIPIYGKHNFQTLKAKKFDYVFLMNSGFSAIQDPKFGPWIPEQVKKSKHAVYIVNDYKLQYPCGYCRYIDPMKYTYWSTVPDYAGRLVKNLVYVNWNKLTYNPISPLKDIKILKCIYWGAYRKDRIKFFERYLNNGFTTVSTSKRAKKGFEESCPKTKILGLFEKDLYRSISRYACTLYIEDNTRKYCSPANRFYEALSAGIPMFFSPESVEHMEMAGYDVRKFVVEDSSDLFKKMVSYPDTTIQRSWRRDYIRELNKEVDEALRSTK